MNYTFQKLLDEHNDVFSSFDETYLKSFELACDKVEFTVRNRSLVAFMGNGGSAADCQHVAAEFVGKFSKLRQAYKAMAFTTDTSILTSLGNDIGYDKVFARQVEAFVERHDVVFGLSTSGQSMNVVNGIKEAKKCGAITISITGSTPGPVSSFADVRLFIPSFNTARIQEATIFTLHALMEEIERRLT